MFPTTLHIAPEHTTRQVHPMSLPSGLEPGVDRTDMVYQSSADSDLLRRAEVDPPVPVLPLGVGRQAQEAAATSESALPPGAGRQGQTAPSQTPAEAAASVCRRLIEGIDSSDETRQHFPVTKNPKGRHRCPPGTREAQRTLFNEFTRLAREMAARQAENRGATTLLDLATGALSGAMAGVVSDMGEAPAPNEPVVAAADALCKMARLSSADLKRAGKVVVALSSIQLPGAEASLVAHKTSGCTAVALNTAPGFLSRALTALTGGAWWCVKPLLVVGLAAGVAYLLLLLVRFLLARRSVAGRLSNLVRAHSEGMPEVYNRVTGKLASWVYKKPSAPAETVNPHQGDHETRANAEKLITACVAASRLEPYFIQKGADGPKGSSVYLDPVDTGTHDIEPKEPIYVMVDVDYYIDMPRFLLEQFRPVIMYTLAPTRPVESTANHHFQIVGDDMVYQSHGGYVCQHPIWRYGADFVTVRGWVWTYVYRVKRVHYPGGRQVLCLIPWAKIPTLWHWYYTCSRVDETILRRVRFMHEAKGEHWTAFQIWGKKGLNVAVAPQAQMTAGDLVPIDAMGKLADCYRALGGDKVSWHNACDIAGGKYPFAAQLVSARINLMDRLDTIHLGTQVKIEEDEPEVERPKTPCPCTLHNNSGDKSTAEGLAYTAREGIIDKVKIGVTPVGPPMNPLSIVKSPTRAPEDKALAIQRRITDQQVKAQEMLDKHPGSTDGLKEAYVQFLRSHGLLKGLSPMSDEEAILLTPKVHQQEMRDALREPLGVHCRNVHVFVKGECYMGLKDPRIITPLHPAVQARLYKYVKVLQHHLHQTPWFAFGNPPPVVAEKTQRIVEIAIKNGWAIYCMDYTRFDGSQLDIIRDIADYVIRCAFEGVGGSDKELDMALALCRYLLDGLRKLAGMASGSAQTCVNNSTLNHAVGFKAIGEAAWDQMLVGGDDGIMTCSQEDADRLVAVSASLGLTIKMRRIERGEPFDFLGRYFGWGTLNSMADPARLMPKLNIIGQAGLAPKYHAARRLDKLESLYQNDHNTPIINTIILWNIEEAKAAKGALLKLPESQKPRDWMKESLCNGSWPNEEEPWMHDLVMENDECRIAYGGWIAAQRPGQRPKPPSDPSIWEGNTFYTDE